jgi:hypothetical protein
MVLVLGLMLSLVVENADLIQETFKFTQPGSVLLIAMWPLYVVYRVICLPFLVVALGGARLI